MRATRSVYLQLYYCLNWTLDGGERFTPRPGRLTPGNVAVPIVYEEAGWVTMPVWTGVENLALTGIRSPDRPVNLSYSVPFHSGLM
jgi:hypothetical protein